MTRGAPRIVRAPLQHRATRRTSASVEPAAEHRFALPTDSASRFVGRATKSSTAAARWRAELKGVDGEPFDLLAKHDQMFRSNLRNILAGDGLPNVSVLDLRGPECR